MHHAEAGSTRAKGIQPSLGFRLSGNKPGADEANAARGRFTIVSSEDRKYLYIPEIQQLCELPQELAMAFVDVVASDRLDLLRAAQQVVAELADRSETPLNPGPGNSFGLKDVVIHVSQLCNLDCSYCYAVELNKAGRLMSSTVADNVVARTMLMAPDGLSSVKFLGGEPTLAWPIVVQLVEQYTVVAAQKHFKPPRFVIVTNGTRVSGSMIDFMAHNEMYVLVSIDGPKDIHDCLRPSQGGQGSYDKASATLRRLVDANVDVAVEAVYTRDHHAAGVSINDMMEHFLEIGVRKFQITLALGTWHGEDNIEHLDDVVTQFSDAARASVRSFRSTQPFLLRGIQFVLDGFSLREQNTHVCGAGRNFMAINFDGEAFPCYLLESSETSYGFIDSRWNPTKYEGVSQKFVKNGKKFHAVCRECWANEICQSCLGSTFLISPEIAKPPAWFCKVQKEMIAAVLGEIAGARASADWPLFVKNMERHLSPIAA